MYGLSPKCMTLQAEPACRDSRRLFREGILCGYISRDGGLHLNPAETAMLDEGDRLIVLANDGEAVALAATAPLPTGGAQVQHVAPV